MKWYYIQDKDWRNFYTLNKTPFDYFTYIMNSIAIQLILLILLERELIMDTIGQL